MRTTAIIRIKRIPCALNGQPGHRCAKDGIEYVAVCADCGASTQSHVRASIDGPGLWVQTHRTSCRAMAARRAS